MGTVEYRVAAFAANGINAISGLTRVHPFTGAYLYLDTNGNAVHDVGDALNETGPTTVDVWLRTNANRNGSETWCSTTGGIANSINSYEVVLRAVGGTVSWSNFTNRIASFGVPLGEFADSTYYANGWGSGTYLAAGTYRIATITVTPQSGTPYLAVAPNVPAASTLITAYGSTCDGLEFDNTLKLGTDWNDVDGTVPGAMWTPGGAKLISGQGDQKYPVSAPDGAGGAILVWEDSRAGSGDKNIYAQRVDATGNPFWASGGVAVCTAPGAQQTPRITLDGTGGAIIAWQDQRSSSDGDIYSQRLDSRGVSQWATNGIAVCTAAYGQLLAGATPDAIVGDGAGGAIIVWQDQRAGGTFHGDIYGQHIDASGSAQWGTNGTAICTAVNFQFEAVAVDDGSGGAFVIWVDYRNDPLQCTCNGSEDLYAQHVTASGAMAWQSDGVPVCTAPGKQWLQAPAQDGAGGAVVAWVDARLSTSPQDIYAQRMASNGTVQWATNGVRVNGSLSRTFALVPTPAIVSDGLGGAIVAWSGGSTVRLQRIDASGGARWDTTGVSVTSSGLAKEPRLAADGAGGAVVLWEDGISAPQLRAQRLEPTNGTTQWATGGVALAPASLPNARLIGDGMGGGIAVWEGPGITDRDIFAMRIAPGGGIYATSIEESAPILNRTRLGPSFPNPFNPMVTIAFSLERQGRARIVIYDVSGRCVRILQDRDTGPGSHSVTWDGVDGRGRNVASGVYYCRLDALGVKLTRTLALIR
jgi:hypothetical protein